MKKATIYFIILGICIGVLISVLRYANKQDDPCRETALQFEKLKTEAETLKRQNDSLMKLNLESKSIEAAEPIKDTKSLGIKNDNSIYIAEKKAAEEKAREYAEKFQAAEMEVVTLKEAINDMEDIYVSYFEIKMEKDTGEDGLSGLEEKYYGKIKTDPEKYFDDYVQCTNKSQTILDKAIVKNRFGTIVLRVNDPLVINTSNFPKGIYYFSFYDEKGELIQKAKVMVKN